MTNEKFASGAFVFTRARGLTPRDPDDLPPLAARHHIEPTFVPEYAGDRVAIGRAITQASSGLQREGLLLRPIKRTSTELVYGVVREQNDGERLDHDFEATVAWSSEPDPSVVTGDHPIARRVADAYRDLRGKIVADDWSAVISNYLEQSHAARVRGDGRVYWVPPGEPLQAVRTLAAFLAEVGIDLITCEIEAESRTVVEAVAQESLDEQIAQLEQEAVEFDGTQKPSTYTRRLDEYQRLRERAVLYRDALGVGVDRTEKVLSQLEQKVTAMLELRQQVVVHRDGTVDNLDVRAREAAVAVPTALRFAGSTFTLADSPDLAVLIFVSDEESARSSVQALEAMGLAGRWQRVGACEVAIQNSGPPGAAVSIRLRLPEGQSLVSATKSLTAIGMTVVAD